MENVTTKESRTAPGRNGPMDATTNVSVRTVPADDTNVTTSTTPPPPPLQSLRFYTHWTTLANNTISCIGLIQF